MQQLKRSAFSTSYSVRLETCNGCYSREGLTSNVHLPSQKWGTCHVRRHVDYLGAKLLLASVVSWCLEYLHSSSCR